MPQYHAIYARQNKGDSPFSPPTAEMLTTDLDKFLNWIDLVISQGYVPVAEVDALASMIQNAGRARELNTNGVFVRTSSKGKKVIIRRAYDPATKANVPSGNGQKPMPRPTRDYRGSAEVAGPWTPLKGGR